jgi:hypothetical protein
MKPIYKNILLIGLSGALILSLLHKPAPDNSKLEQAIKERDESIKREDSIRRHAEQIEEQLETANLLVINAKIDVERANKETRKTITNENKVVFRDFNSDTARYNAWARIYPSIKNR